MSFGFAVGDFIAVRNLIKDIYFCLQESGGAKTEYQDLLRALKSLQQALQHLDKLQPCDSSSTTLDSVKYAALSCQRPLEKFLGQIQKYDRCLGVWGKEGVIASTASKLKWGFVEKEEIRNFQSYINMHIGLINIILTTHGFEKMDLASDQAAADQLDIRQRLDNTRSIIDAISGNVSVQTLVVENTQNMTARLLDIISGDFRASLRSLGEMSAKIL
jgi:multidrug efflux pump subunit AcrA (membrane-fusion protein)